MKRIETLVRLAKEDLDVHQYRTFSRDGYTPLDIARALDKIREAEKVLRRAYDA